MSCNLPPGTGAEGLPQYHRPQRHL
uniref:Uncharacterized protein n=1 Tax=Anguilla anguilla TaxID=7936 RepID=A0A0E9TWS1_ANGAN